MEDAKNRALRMVETFPSLMKVFHRIGSNLVADASITLPQYHAFTAFSVKSNWSLGDLADFLMIRPPAASELVDKLVKAGFLNREVNPSDRRQTIISLTVKGSEVIAERKNQLIESYEKLLSVLTEQDQIAFERALHDLARIATTYERIGQVETV